MNIEINLKNGKKLYLMSDENSFILKVPQNIRTNTRIKHSQTKNDIMTNYINKYFTTLTGALYHILDFYAPAYDDAKSIRELIYLIGSYYKQIKEV